jgi:hypothetical protein
MKEIYGFNYQQYGNCGQFALLNALLLLGIPVTNKQAHIKTGITITKSTISGTDSKNIVKGIKSFNCKAIKFQSDSESETKNRIDYLLSKNIPLILGCENYDHWAVLAGKKANKYYWLDSADEDIIGLSKWDEIEDWIKYEDDYKYFFIAVKPKNSGYSISNPSELYKISYKNEYLFFTCGEKLQDLLEIFHFDAHANYSAAKLLNQYKATIIEGICRLYYYADKSEIEKLFNDYLTIAELYNLKVDKEIRVQALIEFTILLTLCLFE